jgi:hypothetical protein
MDIRAKKDGVFMEGLVAEGDEVNTLICMYNYMHKCMSVVIYTYG